MAPSGTVGEFLGVPEDPPDAPSLAALNDQTTQNGTFGRAIKDYFVDLSHRAGEVAQQQSLVELANSVVKTSREPFCDLSAQQPGSLRDVKVHDGIPYLGTVALMTERHAVDNQGEVPPSSSQLGTSKPDLWMSLTLEVQDNIYMLPSLFGELKVFTGLWQDKTAVQKSRQSWYQAILYSFAAFEQCGTWMGLAMVNECLSRLCVLDDKPLFEVRRKTPSDTTQGFSEQQQLQQQTIEHIKQDAKVFTVAIELSDEARAMVGQQMSIQEFLAHETLPRAFRHRLCELDPDGKPKYHRQDRMYTIDWAGATAFYNTIVKAVQLLARLPMDVAPTRLSPPSETFKAFRDTITGNGKPFNITRADVEVIVGWKREGKKRKGRADAVGASRDPRPPPGGSHGKDPDAADRKGPKDPTQDPKSGDKGSRKSGKSSSSKRSHESSKGGSKSKSACQRAPDEGSASLPEPFKTLKSSLDALFAPSLGPSGRLHEYVSIMVRKLSRHPNLDDPNTAKSVSDPTTAKSVFYPTTAKSVFDRLEECTNDDLSWTGDDMHSSCGSSSEGDDADTSLESALDAGTAAYISDWRMAVDTPTHEDPTLTVCCPETKPSVTIRIVPVSAATMDKLLELRMQA